MGACKFIPNTTVLTWLLLSASAWAGVIDNRSNFSATYLRELARTADTRSPDAAAYNPAGLAFIDQGLHLEIDNQTLVKHNTNGNGLFHFQSDVVSPVLPTGFAVYRHHQWAAFASGTLIGGGGNVHYDKGTVTVLPLVTSLATANPATAPDLQLSSLYWGGTLGFAYSLSSAFALSVAGRWVFASKEIKGEARGENLIDHKETANAPAILFGLHFIPLDGLDIGLRYENIVKLEWEVQNSDLHLERAMNTGAAAIYAQRLRGTLQEKGATFNRDLPPVASVGVGYTVNPYLRVDASETWYLQTIADWGGEEKEVDDGWEAALGIEVSPIPGKLSFSLGAMSTKTGAGPDTYFAESPALDGYTLAGGGHGKVTSRIALDLSVAYSGTYDDHVNIASIGPVSLEKSTWVCGASLGYQIP
jgi:long-chain fatty acid transport protein